ncbi:YitT family protein OS=Streptomyces alboniger OX=132473 GN=CP975_05200 PE=4 SV=1 [Streptomyces alboniger]
MRLLVDRGPERGLRLLCGLALYGVGTASLVRAGLGADPWTVFAEGVARSTRMSLGAVVLLVSAAVFALWLPLRQRPGVGTLANAVLVGPVLDQALKVIPPPQALPWRLGLLGLGTVGIAVATGLYVGAGLGPGPRDGLMTGLARLGVPVLLARTAIECSVLAGGWLLGGTAGIGTAVYALGIGPLVAFFLPRLSLPPDGPSRRSREGRGGRRRGAPGRSRHPWA